MGCPKCNSERIVNGCKFTKYKTNMYIRQRFKCKKIKEVIRISKLKKYYINKYENKQMQLHLWMVSVKKTHSLHFRFMQMEKLMFGTIITGIIVVIFLGFMLYFNSPSMCEREFSYCLK